MRLVIWMVVLATVQVTFVSGNLFGNIYRARDAMIKAQEKMRGITSGIYSSIYKASSLRIIGLDIGIDKGFFDIKNLYSYTNQMLKTKDIIFLIEQDGYGEINAQFNTRRVSCSGLAQNRYKKCTVPASFRPWNGRFVVEMWGKGGRRLSAGFSMAAKAFCPVAGFQGDNCDQDIDECAKYKGQRICSWIDGCINTYGSYRCKCPTGYTVSPKDFRLCHAIKPKIVSKPQNFVVYFGSNVALPCRSESTSIGITKWYLGSKLVGLRTNNVLKVLQPKRMTIQSNGSLVLMDVKYGDMGDFLCQVIVGQLGAFIVHRLRVESKPIMEGGVPANGKYLNVYTAKLGEKVNMDCKTLALPLATTKWMKDGRLVEPNLNIKVNKLQESVNVASLQNIENLRIFIDSVEASNAGIYECLATNKYGSESVKIQLLVQ